MPAIRKPLMAIKVTPEVFQTILRAQVIPGALWLMGSKAFNISTNSKPVSLPPSMASSTQLYNCTTACTVRHLFFLPCGGKET